MRSTPGVAMQVEQCIGQDLSDHKVLTPPTYIHSQKANLDPCACSTTTQCWTHHQGAVYQCLALLAVARAPAQEARVVLDVLH